MYFLSIGDDPQLIWKFLWQSLQLIKQGPRSCWLHRAHDLHSAQYHLFPLSTKLDSCIIRFLLILPAGTAHDECKYVFLHSQHAVNGSARFWEFFKSDPRHFTHIAFTLWALLPSVWKQKFNGLLTFLLCVISSGKFCGSNLVLRWFWWELAMALISNKKNFDRSLGGPRVIIKLTLPFSTLERLSL